MASPLPEESAIDRYVVTDEEFESLQNFDWSSVSSEILTDLEFITKLPTNPVLDYDALGPLLPPRGEDAPQKTLFIDLDETLVHTSLRVGGANAADTTIQVRHDLSFISDADGSVQARVYFRPWTHDFLKIISNYYELVLYTASVKLYADIIVDELDPEGFITHRLYREHCTQYGESEIYFKDLNGTGRGLKESVVMDNRLISFGLNVANGIFVSSFTGQPNDTELLHLLPILVALSKQEDVRLALSETYKLPTIVQRYKQDIHVDVIRSLTNIGSPRAHRVDESTSLHTHAICTLGSLPGTPSTTTTTTSGGGSGGGGGGEMRLDEGGGGCDEDDLMGVSDKATIMTEGSENGGGVSPAKQSTCEGRADGPLCCRKNCSTMGTCECCCCRELLISSGCRELLSGGASLIPDRETSPAESVATTSTRQASSTRHMAALSRISYSRDEARLSAATSADTSVNIRLPSVPQRQGSLRRLVLPPSSPERRRRQSNPFKQTSARVAITVHSSSKKQTPPPTAPKRLY